MKTQRLWVLLGVLIIMSLAPGISHASVAVGDRVFVFQSANIFSWPPATGEVDRYNVFLAKDGSPYTKIGETQTNNHQIFLEDGRSHRVRVEAENTAGVGPMSDPSSEVIYFANGSENDIDGDGMPNSWEELYGLNPYDPSDASMDLDGDGFSNLEEYLLGYPPDQPEEIILLSAVQNPLTKIYTLKLALIRDQNGQNGSPAVVGESTGWQVKFLSEIHNEIYNVFEVDTYNQDLVFTYWWDYYQGKMAPIWKFRLFEADEGEGMIVARHKDGEIYQRGQVAFDPPPGEVGDDFIRFSRQGDRLLVYPNNNCVIGLLQGLNFWGNPTDWQEKIYQGFNNASGWGVIEFNFYDLPPVLEFVFGSEGEGAWSEYQDSQFFNHEKGVFVVDIYALFEEEAPEDIVLLDSWQDPETKMYHYILGSLDGPSGICTAPFVRGGYNDWDFLMLNQAVKHKNAYYYPFEVVSYDRDFEMNRGYNRWAGIYAVPKGKHYVPEKGHYVIRLKNGQLYAQDEVDFDPLPGVFGDNHVRFERLSNGLIRIHFNALNIQVMITNLFVFGNMNNWSTKIYLNVADSSGWAYVDFFSLPSSLNFIYGSEAAGSWTDYRASNWFNSTSWMITIPNTSLILNNI